MEVENATRARLCSTSKSAAWALSGLRFFLFGSGPGLHPFLLRLNVVAHLLEHGLVTEVPVKILDAATKANFRSFYQHLETATTSRKLGHSPDSVDTVTQTCTQPLSLFFF